MSSEGKKKVLLCGASGFIGRNLLEDLARDPKVELYALAHRTPLPEEWARSSSVRVVHADLRNPQDVERVVSGMDAVIQAAASTTGFKDTLSRPHRHITDNTIMNSLLLKTVFEAQVGHLVFLSCSVMYPSSPKPVKETDFNYQIEDKYFGGGWYKVYVEKLCEFYSRLGKTKFTAIRHSNIYGPHDKYDLERSHVFGATVTKVMTAANGKVTVWGDGSETRDLLHVDDLVRFIRLVLKKQEAPFELVNVGAGSAISIADLVSRVIRLSGRDLKVEFDAAKPAAPFHLSLDCSRAKSVYGWTPSVSLEEGIRRTLEWYRSQAKAHPAAESLA